jgi:hypothetical protein
MLPILGLDDLTRYYAENSCRPALQVSPGSAAASVCTPRPGRPQLSPRVASGAARGGPATPQHAPVRTHPPAPRQPGRRSSLSRVSLPAQPLAAATAALPSLIYAPSSLPMAPRRLPGSGRFPAATLVQPCPCPLFGVTERRRPLRQAVGVPLLCLSAADDPVVDAALLRHAKDAAASNPHILLAITRRGGHLGARRAASAHGRTKLPTRARHGACAQHGARADCSSCAVPCASARAVPHALTAGPQAG